MIIPGLTQHALTCLPKARVISSAESSLNTEILSAIYGAPSVYVLDTSYDIQLQVLMRAYFRIFPESDFRSFQTIIADGYFASSQGAEFFVDIQKGLEEIYVYFYQKMQTEDADSQKIYKERMARFALQLIADPVETYIAIQDMLAEIREPDFSLAGLIAKKRQAVMDDFAKEYSEREQSDLLQNGIRFHVYRLAEKQGVAGLMPTTAVIDSYHAEENPLLSQTENFLAYMQRHFTPRALSQFITEHYQQLFAPFQKENLTAVELAKFRQLLQPFTNDHIFEEDLGHTSPIPRWFFEYLPYFVHQLLMKKYVQKSSPYCHQFSYADSVIAPLPWMSVEAESWVNFSDLKSGVLTQAWQQAISPLRLNLIDVDTECNLLALSHSIVLNVDILGDRLVTYQECQAPNGGKWQDRYDDLNQVVFVPSAGGYVQLHHLLAYDALTEERMSSLNYALNLKRLAERLTQESYSALFPEAWQTQAALKKLAQFHPLFLTAENIIPLMALTPDAFSSNVRAVLNDFLMKYQDINFVRQWISFCAQHHDVPLKNIAKLSEPLCDIAWLSQHVEIVKNKRELTTFLQLLKQTISFEEASAFFELHRADAHFSTALGAIADFSAATRAVQQEPNPYHQFAQTVVRQSPAFIVRVAGVFGSLLQAHTALQQRTQASFWQRVYNRVCCLFSSAAREKRALLTELINPKPALQRPVNDVLPVLEAEPVAADDSASLSAAPSPVHTVVVEDPTASLPEQQEMQGEEVVAPAPVSVVPAAPLVDLWPALNAALESFNAAVPDHKHNCLDGLVRNAHSTNFFRPKTQRMAVFNDYKDAFLRSAQQMAKALYAYLEKGTLLDAKHKIVLQAFQQTLSKFPQQEDSHFQALNQALTSFLQDTSTIEVADKLRVAFAPQDFIRAEFTR